MEKYFNTEGACNPKEHYMVNLDERLSDIKELVDKKKYFSINRARQYGKTTTLKMLEHRLQEDYVVFSVSFEGLADEEYESQKSFCQNFIGLLSDTIHYGEIEGLPEEIILELEEMSRPEADNITFRSLANLISYMCKVAKKPVVLMIDEADQAGNHKLFLDFLGMLRKLYLDRAKRPTFQSVILAGVYDVRNLIVKIRDEKEHQKNSPWNIATDFEIDMSFGKHDIAGMLEEYEAECQSGMNVDEMSQLIYDYTSGYPVLVSRLCKIIDERIAKRSEYSGKASAWTKEGFLEAVKIILIEKNPLFESLINKLEDYPELKTMMRQILFSGDTISFNIFNHVIDIAYMFGFVKNDNGRLAIANRIFETVLYNLFTSEEEVNSKIFDAGSVDKNQFIQNGVLNMDLVMEKFMVHWNELYNSSDEAFIEENGRKFFLLYLKPIINGTGNFYVEAETRNKRRTDVIVDYRGQQYIIEIKIWRGDEYNRRGEAQLADYLDAYQASKGYLLSFNFNKNKVTGMKEIECGEKTIFEVVV